MAEKHKHAALLDRLGQAKVHTRYNIKPRTWRHWRANGIPSLYWNGIRDLAATSGLTSQELDQ